MYEIRTYLILHKYINLRDIINARTTVLKKLNALASHAIANSFSTASWWKQNNVFNHKLCVIWVFRSDLMHSCGIIHIVLS